MSQSFNLHSRQISQRLLSTKAVNGQLVYNKTVRYCFFQNNAHNQLILNLFICVSFRVIRVEG